MRTCLGLAHLVVFHCNICGCENKIQLNTFHRELAFCKSCGSNARFRGIVSVLGELLGENPHKAIFDWTPNKSIRGLGMSDWLGYAKILQKKFNYENTFYDLQPRFDIHDMPIQYANTHDFIISTDVLEHILPPVQRGFDNFFKMLRPGGKLIFSVPYSRESSTREHYPGINDFEIIDFKGCKILLNRDLSGALQVYDNLSFHGGGGSTLEMRVFSESDVLCCLTKAGFLNVCVYDQPRFEVGYYWPELVSDNPNSPTLFAYIISAIKPVDGDE